MMAYVNAPTRTEATKYDLNYGRNYDQKLRRESSNPTFIVHFLDDFPEVFDMLIFT
jgi:hypothetical protein